MTSHQVRGIPWWSEGSSTADINNYLLCCVIVELHRSTQINLPTCIINYWVLQWLTNEHQNWLKEPSTSTCFWSSSPHTQIDHRKSVIIQHCNYIIYIALLHYCSNIQSSIKVLSTYLTVILVWFLLQVNCKLEMVVRTLFNRVLKHRYLSARYIF